MTDIPVIRHDISPCQLNSVCRPGAIPEPGISIPWSERHSFFGTGHHDLKTIRIIRLGMPSSSSDTIIPFAAHLTAAVNGQHFPDPGQTPTG